MEVKILRGQSMQDLWRRVFGETHGSGRFNATYVSPGKVRTAQALAGANSRLGDLEKHLSSANLQLATLATKDLAAAREKASEGPRETCSYNLELV